MIRRWLNRRRERERARKLEAIEQLLHLLTTSVDSDYSGFSSTELVERVESVKTELQAGNLNASKDLWALFVPTGPLQETAIDNGWGDQFLDIADRLT